jgi:hypothetical protein
MQPKSDFTHLRLDVQIFYLSIYLRLDVIEGRLNFCLSALLYQHSPSQSM